MLVEKGLDALWGEVAHTRCLDWQSRTSFLVVEKKKKYLFRFGRMYSCRYGNAAFICQTKVKFLFLYFSWRFFSSVPLRTPHMFGLEGGSAEKHAFSEGQWVWYNNVFTTPKSNGSAIKARHMLKWQASDQKWLCTRSSRHSSYTLSHSHAVSCYATHFVVRAMPGQMEYTGGPVPCCHRDMESMSRLVIVVQWVNECLCLFSFVRHGAVMVLVLVCLF